MDISVTKFQMGWTPGQIVHEETALPNYENERNQYTGHKLAAFAIA